MDFDCGPFQRGVLFEDAMIGGKRRQRSEIVSLPRATVNGWRGQ